MERNWTAFTLLVLFGATLFLYQIADSLRAEPALLPADFSQSVQSFKLQEGDSILSFARSENGEFRCSSLDGLPPKRGWIQQLLRLPEATSDAKPLQGEWAGFAAQSTVAEVSFQLKNGSSEQLEFGRHNSYLDRDYIRRQSDGKIFLISPTVRKLLFPERSAQFEHRLIPYEEEEVRQLVRMTAGEVLTVQRPQSEWVLDGEAADGRFIRAWVGEVLKLEASAVIPIQEQEMREKLSNVLVSLIVSPLDSTRPPYYVRIAAGSDPELSRAQDIFYAFVEGRQVGYLLSPESVKQVLARREAFLVTQG